MAAIYAVDGAGSMSVFAATGAPLVTVPVPEDSRNLVVGGDGSVYLLQSLRFKTDHRKALPKRLSRHRKHDVLGNDVCGK